MLSPGKSCRKLSRSAWCSVVNAGEKSAACAKATSSGDFVARLTWFAVCNVGVACSIAELINGRCIGTGVFHSPVCVFRVPCSSG